MAIYRTENSEVEQILQNMEEIIIAQDGFLHPELEIHENDGSLRVFGPPSEGMDDQHLIVIPQSCLLPVEQVFWEIQDNELALAGKSPDLTSGRAALFDLITALYRVTGKLEKHRTQSLWPYLADEPDVCEWLVRKRGQANVLAPFLRLATKGRSDELVIESFLKKRTLAFMQQGADAPTRMVLPFIDCFNHHPWARDFQITGEEGSAPKLAVVNSQPVSGSRECFTHYGLYDACDTALVYNFANDVAPFVRSVPLEIRLGKHGRLINCAAMMPMYGGPLPEDMEGLRPFVPTLLNYDSRFFEISHLLIPDPSMEGGMRRVLWFLISNFLPSLSEQALDDLVADAEAQILSANQEYYSGFSALLSDKAEAAAEAESKQPLALLRRALDIQESKLAAYRLAVAA